MSAARRPARRLGVLALEIWLPAGILLLWWLATIDGGSAFLPSLDRIWAAFQENWLFERVGSDLVPTVLLFVGGLGIAIVSGVTFGLILGMWSIGRQALSPTVDFLRSIPGPALISVFIALFGFGDAMKLAVVSFAATFPILLNTIDGVRGVGVMQLEVAESYRLRTRDRILRIVLPAASPQIFAGIRISLAVALAVLVFSQMIAGGGGLGFFILISQQTFQVAAMWSGIIVLGLLGYALNLVFNILERSIMAWHIGWRTASQDGERSSV